MLNLAGATIPPWVDGRPFLGPGTTLEEVGRRDVSFGYADRMDEKYDLVRTVRKGKYHYMRNFQPHYSDGLQNNYRYKMLAYQEWREQFQDGKLSNAQSSFFRERPVELLFDCESDPWNVRNLAEDSAYAEVIEEMRDLLGKQLRLLPDLSFFPESYLVEHALKGVPSEFAQSQKVAIGRYVDIADLALAPFDEAEELLRLALVSADPMERYWGAMAAMAHRREDGAQRLAPVVRELLDGKIPVVRIRAAEFLGEIGSLDPQPIFTAVVNSTDNAMLALEALQAIVHFHDKADGSGRRYPADVDSLNPAAKSWEIEQRMSYLRGKTPRRVRADTSHRNRPG